MDELVKLLDGNLICTSTDITANFIHFYVESTQKECTCPSCQTVSSRIHSRYKRTFQDLPIQDKKVMITLTNRKMFCDNPLCDRTTFAESFSFIDNKAKKTKRLIEVIIEISLTQSSVSAATYLTQHIADVKKSSICNYQKKNEPIINKEKIDAVCIDDFALKKRSSYGTIMVNLNDGRVIDIIDSRDKDDVVAWLSQYPNIKYFSRDGSLTYASAIREAHPDAHHISDRFHLVKNLTDAVTQCIYKFLSGRIVIPLTKENKVMNELLSSKPSRRDKILLVKSLASQGRTTQEIRSLTKCSLQTIQKYIKMDEKDIPKNTDDKRGQEHREAIEKILARAEKVRALHDKGYSIRQIVDMTGHTKKTIKNYLSPNFNPIHGQYGVQRPGKLSPFRNEVISMRSKGIPYKDIHAAICKKGYTGSVAAIRQFIAKEKRLERDLKDYDSTGSSEIIERKWLLKLLYKPLEQVKQLTHEQVKNAFNKYPLLGKLHDLVWNFKEILLSGKKESLQVWIAKVESLELSELNSFLNSLKKDIDAVENAFIFPYNNGLAEGSINKLKTIKRIMYGRSSFELLRKKLLMLESRKFN